MGGVIRRMRWLIAVSVVMVSVLAAAPASASCAEPIPVGQALEEARTVFVGTVTDVDYAGRVATFSIEEVWKGEVGGTAVVAGGPTLSELEQAHAQGGDVATSVDRTYEIGGRYLVVSYRSDGAVLLDNACSATQPFGADLESFRPDSAHAPAGSEPVAVTETAPGILAWTVLGALTLALAGGAVLIVWRTHRHDRSGPAAA